MSDRDLTSFLLDVYHRLMAYYGPQHWWPAERPFEVIVGAILTQSAAWSNVEKGIANLKAADVLSPASIRVLPVRELAKLIYPCGYYNAKAVKLKAFAQWMGENYQDDLISLFGQDANQLREQLLLVHGIGDETADSIILYAGNKPVFVIDAYTRRILGRLGIPVEKERYEYYQKRFTENLPPDVTLFNEYHALLVRLGKDVCYRQQPDCMRCPLNNLCAFENQMK